MVMAARAKQMLLTEKGKRAPKVVLTEKFLRSLSKQKHPGKPPRIFYYDAVLPGLNVMWTSTGHLSCGMTRRWPGQRFPTWRKLGDLYLPVQDKETRDEERDEEERTEGALKLAEVRSKGRRWLDMLSRGIDPAAEAKRVREENRRRYTFAQARDEHILHHWKRNGLAKAGEADRLLKREFSAWDEKLAEGITREDVDEAIQVIVQRGALAQARNSLGYLRGLYAWLIDNPRYGIKKSPCEGLRPAKMIGAKESRQRWLRDHELRDVWNAAGQLGLAGPVIKLLIITAKRLNEIAGLRWSEIDFDKGEIIIPGGRMGRMKGKARAPDHMVPITPKVREILEAIRRGASGDFVFSTTGGAKQMTIGSKIKDKLDTLLAWSPKINEEGEDENAWVFHDLRRTARTNFSKPELGIAEEVREALVAHVKQGMIKTYDIYDFAEGKRIGQTRWENRIAKIVDPPPADVTDLDAARERRAAS
jgi:integrase